MVITIQGVEYKKVEVWLGPGGDDGLYGVGLSPKGSVFEGEESFSWLGDYEEMKNEFPGLSRDGRGRPPHPRLGDTAPSWFDAANAGESWGDDY